MILIRIVLLTLIHFTSRTWMTVHAANRNEPDLGFPRNLDAYLSENQPRGTKIIRLKPKDENFGTNTRIAYYLPPAYASLVQVGVDTGVVVTNRIIDREKQPIIEFEVVAYDKLNTSINATVHVRVFIEDENDNAPRFEQSYNFMVRENTIGLVGYVKATDEDEGRNAYLVYRLANKQNHWDLSAGGILSLTSPLDREVKSEYTLIVLAIDSGSPSHTSATMVRVFVIDENDNAPQFKFPNRRDNVVNISNNVPAGSIVSRVLAMDHDVEENGKLRYRLLNTDSCTAYFVLDEMSGNVQLNRSLGGNSPFICRLDVSARDCGFPQRTTNAVLLINVLRSTESEIKVND